MLSAEAELGAVQSKATKLVLGTVQVRLRTHTTFQRVIQCPRGDFGLLLFPSNQFLKALNPVALRCSGRYAGATDQRQDGAPRLRSPSCARRPGRASLLRGCPSAFAPADTAAGSAPCARHTPPMPRADSRITALGHATWHALATTAAFAGTKPSVGTDGATIVEPMPIADLACEHNAGELAHSA